MSWPALSQHPLGLLDADAFPYFAMLASGNGSDVLNGVIGVFAAAMVVVGALVVLGLLTYYHGWRWLWRNWLTSLDHKKIGIMYVVLALVMMARAIAEAGLMRAQGAAGLGGGFVSPEHFAQLFSTHGTIMIFFMAMPFLTGLINYVVPLQIGARDVSFPRLNAVSLWLTVAGAGLVMISLVVGAFSTGGWFGYPPYTEKPYSPGVGVDYWIWSLTLASMASTLTGINIAVTIYKQRAPGMTLYAMPLFTWTALCTAIVMVFAMPPLTVATLQLALDRYLGFHFFTNGLGGNQMNFANLFWLFGHPEVYILILPAFGVFSEVFSTFSGKALFGYKSLVWATMSIAFLSFLVWVHHFFTMGQSAHINAAFGIASMLIGIPTGVKVYDWMWTMFRGRVRFGVPMIYAIAFLFLFVIGGITGIMLANPILDYQVHNTVFLVAHFHNMAVPGVLFGMLAGYTYWFPKAFGFRLNERWGRISAYCWIFGWMGAFFPLYVLGLMGLPRRSVAYDDARYLPLEVIAFVGALVVAAALASLLIQLWVSVRDRELNRVPVGDPWDGRSLEWATPAPPPAYNFAVIPTVTGRDAFTAAKEFGVGYQEPEHYEDIALPGRSALGLLLGGAGFVLAFALTWQIWWLALLALVVTTLTLLVRGFQRDAPQIIAAQAVRRAHQQWTHAARHAPAIRRSAETTSANRGLAVLETRGAAA